MYSEELDSTTMNHSDIPGLSAITVSGKKYIANLVWTPSASAHEADVSKNELCYQLGSDNYCRYKPTRHLVQYGVVASNQNDCHGIPALAANIKAQNGYSFCGVWQTDEGFWIILAFDDDQGVLVDALFDSKEEAKSELERAILQFDYQVTFVPDSSWGLIDDGASYPELKELLKSKAKCLITNVKKRRIKTILYFIGVVLVAAGIFYAYDYWQDMIQKEKEKKAFEQSKRHHKPKIKIDPPPWLSKPSQNDFITTCIDELTKHDLDTALIPGWSEESSSLRVCNVTGVKYRIHRNDASENWFDFMKQHINSNITAQLSKLDSDSAELTWPVNFKSENTGHQFFSYHNVVEYLASEFNEMKKPSINFDSVNVQSGYVGWQVYTFKFPLGQDPYLYLPILNKIDNMTFTELRYSKSGHSWEMSGALYEKIPQQNLNN